METFIKLSSRVSTMLEQIIKKINTKGWKAYEITEAETLSTAVSRGPAEQLVLGKLYVLVPQVDDHFSIQQVEEALQKMKSQSIYPLVRYRGQSVSIAVLTPLKRYILIQGLRNEKVGYRDFYHCLNSLPCFPLPN